MNNIIYIDKNHVSQQDILNAKQNVDLLYIANLIPSTTGWSEFIDHCDYTVKHPEVTLPSPVKVIGALQIWDDLFMAGYNVSSGNCFSQLEEVFAKTTELFGRRPNNGCTLINFVGQQKTIPWPGCLPLLSFFYAALLLSLQMCSQTGCSTITPYCNVASTYPFGVLLQPEKK